MSIAQEEQKKRDELRMKSIRLLQENAIVYEAMRDDFRYLVVNGPNGKIDFYPGTGRWADRKTKAKANGILALILFCTRGQEYAP